MLDAQDKRRVTRRRKILTRFRATIRRSTGQLNSQRVRRLCRRHAGDEDPDEGLPGRQNDGHLPAGSGFDPIHDFMDYSYDQC